MKNNIDLMAIVYIYITFVEIVNKTMEILIESMAIGVNLIRVVSVVNIYP